MRLFILTLLLSCWAAPPALLANDDPPATAANLQHQVDAHVTISGRYVGGQLNIDLEAVRVRSATGKILALTVTALPQQRALHAVIEPAAPQDLKDKIEADKPVISMTGAVEGHKISFVVAELGKSDSGSKAVVSVISGEPGNYQTTPVAELSLSGLPETDAN